MRNFLLISFFCFLFVGWKSALALEVYTLVDASCQFSSGIIIEMDESHAGMISLTGDYLSVPQAGIKYVMIYNINNNLIPQIQLTEKLLSTLKEVYIKDSKEPEITGWPVSFLENFVIIYDIEGKTSLIDIENVTRIQTSSHSHNEQLVLQDVREVKLQVQQAVSECSAKETSIKKTIAPTRILSDQIQISQLFTSYRRGFSQLNKFQAQTRFYTKPYVFEQETRLGTAFQLQPQELSFPLLPSIQWASGKSYSHQGLFGVGTLHVPQLPNVEPQAIIQTEAKSNFFHALFAGNFFATGAGQSFIIDQRAFFTENHKKMMEKDIFLYPSFNHFTLSGLDWDRYSISGGFFYPIFAIHANKVFREIVTSQAAPMFRFRYITAKNQWKSIFSLMKIEGNNSSAKEIKVIASEEMVGVDKITDDSLNLRKQLTRFRFKANFLRLGWKREQTSKIQLGIDEVFLQGRYEETFQGDNNYLNFQHLITTLFVRQKFSQYIQAAVHLNVYFKQYDYEFQQTKKTAHDPAYSATLIIEFIL